MTRARSLSLLANSNIFTVDQSNSRVGIGSTIPDVKLDVDGDMNVSGTLTYEDVTNVETTGITTTGGLVVTGLGATIGGITTFFGDLNFGAAGVGGTVTTLGHGGFTGIVTALGFQATGVVTAASFRGDGSQLSGISVDSSSLVDSGETTRVAANTSGIVITGITTTTDTVKAADGHVELLLDSGNGRIKLNSSGDATNIDLFGSDGSATFKGDLTIADKIIHDGDTNTAIRFPGNDTFTVETAGAENARFTSSSITFKAPDGGSRYLFGEMGNSADAELSIYDSSDAQKVRIAAANNTFFNGGAVIVNGTTTGSSAKFEVRSTTGSISSATARLNGDATDTGAINTGSSLLFAGHDGGNANRDFASIFAGKENGTSGNYDAYLSFGTRSNGSALAERLRITSSGLIGVNVTPTQQKLTIDVDSSGTTPASFDGINIVNTNSTTNNGSAIIFGQTIAGNSNARIGVINSDRSGSSEDQDIFFGTLGGGSYGERVRITSDGHMSLGGGTTPASTNGGIGLKFGIKSSANNIIIGESTSSSHNGLIFESRITGRSGNARCSQIRMGIGEITLSTAASGADVTEKFRIESNGNVLPGADNGQDLGSTAKRWANIYSADLQLSNEGSANDVDGTWGQYTIQEGENDLFLLNRRSGKKYKFMLEEV